MGDTAYGAAFNLGFLVEEKSIEPHIPVRDKTARNDNTLSSAEFLWDEDKQQYTCPADKLLKSHRGKSRNDRNGVTSANGIIYRATAKDCKHCELKDRCCPNTSHRKITRSIHEAARDKARSITASDEYLNKSRSERKKVEMLFAHMKRHLGFNRLRLRGLKSANDEFLLVATAQNLRRMARLCAQPPPGYGVTALEIPERA